jgi:putative flippase GtrA
MPDAISCDTAILARLVLKRGWTFRNVCRDLAEQFTRMIAISLASRLLSTMVATGFSSIVPAPLARLASPPPMFFRSLGTSWRFVFWREG